jgi:hypothetical protein
MYLRGELGISVLSFLLSKNGTGVKVVNDGDLPIHSAAHYSCLEVVKFLHKAYPESISMLDAGDYERSLLYLAVCNNTNDIADMIGKVQYLCDHCPALIHLKDNDGETALHDLLNSRARSKFECVRILCDMDSTVVRDKCTPSDITRSRSGQLPLHLLIQCQSLIVEVFDEGDCFRLLLNLYPATAGVKDDHLKSPYDMAVAQRMNPYFLRFLLAADPTIDLARYVCMCRCACGPS